MPTGAELATAWVRLVPSFDGAQGEIAGAFKPVEDEADAAGKRAGGKMSAGMKTALIAGAGALALGVGKILGDSITNASDLNEAGTAVGEIFGSSFSTVDKWAANAAGSLGQSQLEALNAAKSFGVFGSAAGLSQEANAEFSTGLAELASDFASFHNVSPEEAIEAIGAGLRGEAEPLRKFGVLMDDASLKAKAMELGIYDGNGALDQRQKIMAANALITEQAGAAQGDFARTSDGLANQQRILDATMTNLSATVGSALLPAVTGLVSGLVPLAEWFGENTWAIAAIAGVIGVTLVAAFFAWTASIWASTVALLANPITWVVIAILALIAVVVLLVMNWDTVVAFLTDVWNGFITWFTGVMDAFLGWWNGLWTSVWEWLVSVWNGIVAFVNLALAAFFMTFRVIGDAISNWWNGLWNGIASFFGGIWDSIMSTIQNVQNGFRVVFEAIAGIVRGAFEGVVSIVKGVINGIIDAVNGAIGGINSVAGAIGGALGIDIQLGKIPRLAEGATILPKRGGTLAVLAEAGRPETVVDTGLMNRALEEGLGNSGAQVLVIVDKDGQLIGRMRVEARNEVSKFSTAKDAENTRGYRGGF